MGKSSGLTNRYHLYSGEYECVQWICTEVHANLSSQYWGVVKGNVAQLLRYFTVKFRAPWSPQSLKTEGGHLEELLICKFFSLLFLKISKIVPLWRKGTPVQLITEAAFELWGIRLHWYKTAEPPSCFSPIWDCVLSRPTSNLPPPFFPGAADLYLSKPHLPAAPTPPYLSPASLSLTCINWCLCLPYLLTLHHWFGIELFRRRMVPHSSAGDWRCLWMGFLSGEPDSHGVLFFSFFFFVREPWRLSLTHRLLCLAHIFIRHTKRANPETV